MTSITLTATQAEGAEINNMHFGINATASWQDFGNLKASIRNLKENGMEIETIRYPGGVETERFFDITDYDDTYWVEQNTGAERYDFIPMSDFMAYCVEEGIRPVIVIPISNLYIDDGNIPTPNTDMKAALETFVHDAMDMMGVVGVAAFELGNEYWVTMGASAYGDIASWAAKVVQDAIDDYNTTNGSGPGLGEPDILVQMWVDPNDNSDTPITYEELTVRNQNMINQFSTEELAAIDGVTAHFYFKDGKFADYAPNTEHTYENLEEVMSHMFEMQAAWEVASGKEINFYITEWNTHLKINDFTGIKQVAPMLEMFTQYLTNGVDNMQLWAMQFNAAAVADSTGETNFIGDFLTLLQDKTVGMTAMNFDFSDPNASVHAFIDGDKVVMFVSSLTDVSQSIDLQLRELFAYPAHFLLELPDYDMTLLDVDPASVDGYYKNGQFDDDGWDEHLEPDAAMLATPDVSYTSNHDGSLSFDLDGHAIMMIEFDRSVVGELIVGTDDNDILYGTPGDDILTGLDGDDIFYDSGGSDFHHGLGGTKDEVRYTESTSGLTIDLKNGNSTGIAEGDSYSTIERLRGSNFDDVIIGGAGIASLKGEGGDDIIIDGTEKNALTGGSGADTFRLIAGDGHEERIFDFTLGEDLLDLSFWGVTSLDQLTFEESVNGKNLVIIFEDERVRLNGFKAEDISSFTDSAFVFVDGPPASGSNDLILGSSGNDIIDANFQGGVDDSGQIINALEGNDDIYDGGGDDLVNGGAGKDRFYAGGGADAYDGGEDNKDEVLYTTSSVGLTIDLTNTTNSTGVATGDSYVNIERLTGSSFDDVIIGGNGIVNLKGAEGNDVITDGMVKNYLTGGTGQDTFQMIAGDGHEDRIYDFTLGEDVLDLSLWGVTALEDLTINPVRDGNSLVISYGEESVRLNGFKQFDIPLFTESAFVFAQPPSDGIVSGTFGWDVIDTNYVDIDGDRINDTGQLIQGGSGRDIIYDGAGDDIVEGGNGKDSFYAGAGADAYDGGDFPQDEIRYTTSTIGLTIDWNNPSNNTGIAAGDTIVSVERVRGSNYDDIIVAGSGVTNIKGMGGDDLLIDSDIAAIEYLGGGNGADTFRFVAGDEQQERIVDFDVTEDILDLSLWGVTAVEDLTFTEVSSYNGHLIIEFGDESLRVDGYTSIDVADFDESVFIFA